MNLVLCNLSSSRLGYQGNLNSLIVGRKFWWEFCSSQNQLLCIKIPLVNPYLSKHDVEEYSLIPNSQQCLLSMMGSLALSNFILLPKDILRFQLSSVHWLSWEPILSEEAVSEKKKIFQRTVFQKRLLKIQFVQQMSQNKVAQILQK